LSALTDVSQEADVELETDTVEAPPDSSPPDSTSSPDIPVITDPGKDAYDRLCSGCHGTGDSAGLGSTLAPPIRFPSRGYAGHVIRAGRDEMAAFAVAMPAFDATALPDDTLVALFDYLDDFEKPSDGGELFVLFCANCHGADAKGGRVSKGIRSNGSGDYVEKVREVEGGSAYGSRTNYMPSWASDVLSKDDISAIVAYVKSL
jgi:mono/diheme cytochrome c family protein